jgi:competence protein ComGC
VFKAKNEQGYALVSVLLVIVIFMVLILSFIGQSSNSIKQNQVVENSSQSVALGEMGIAYYQSAVKNIYVASQDSVNTTIQGEIATNGSQKGADYYQQRAVAVMKDKIKTGLNSVPTEKQVGTNASYKLIYNSLQYSSTDNYITLKVQGIENGKPTTLTTILELSPTVSGLNSSSGSLPLISISLTGVISLFDTLTKPLNLPSACNNPASIGSLYSICNKVLLTTTKSYSDNVNKLSGTSTIPYLIYSTAALTVGGNANSMEFVQIHSDGNLSIGQNMNNASNVTLESKSSISIGSQLRLDASKLYANGDLNVDGQLNLENSTTAIVGGNATISKHLNILTGAKLCVSGNLTANMLKSSTITGSLLVKGTINGKPSGVTAQDFQQKCSSGSATTPTIDWGNELLSTVDYEYQ